ncbi:MAG TPA: diguanylate cyclase, partial [Bradyrhizobium sp.]|nr:diguanylate cyclase [Bradyrhizobium sp.]
MQLANQRELPEQETPPSIRAALIDSLFEASGTVLTGIVFSAVAATMTALKTGQTLAWAFVPLLILAGAARAFDLRRYQARKSTLTAEEAARWQKRYQIGAMIQAAVIGLWCSTTLLSSDDAVVHMICLSVTTGIVAGAAGRAYGRQAIFRLQAGLMFGPAVIALALHATPYYIAMSVVCAAFLMAVTQLSANLHRIFMGAVMAREREAALAGQFDTALNNMPHGLCMFRADGRLAVMNHRFSEMMNLPDYFVQSEVSASDVVEACGAAGAISAASGRIILAEIEDSQARDIITADSHASNDRALSWKFQPMTGGGTVVLVEDITERRNAEARISHLARYDELTALPNRLNFRDEIGRLLAGQQGAAQLSALLFVDLDQFKQVNDTLGHPCGDQLLCAVADRLREMLRPEDFVARFGGDEFVVFQQNIHTAEDAAVLARRIVDRLSERYKIDNHLVEIGASVGIAMTSPGVSADTLLKNADMALYRAKADGRGTFCFFRDEMAQTVEARRVLELDLRKALANEEFELFYQPLVNLKSGRISTCEALLRWNHPVRGTVSPIDIIPVAEDMGLIVDLGRWILRKACMECMRWPEAVSVAVNFSPQQFHQRDVLSEVRYALEVSGLPAHRLEIEITESSLLRNTQFTHDVLSQLQVLGVRISLDDFG